MRNPQIARTADRASHGCFVAVERSSQGNQSLSSIQNDIHIECIGSTAPVVQIQGGSAAHGQRSRSVHSYAVGNVHRYVLTQHDIHGSSPSRFILPQGKSPTFHHQRGAVGIDKSIPVDSQGAVSRLAYGTANTAGQRSISRSDGQGTRPFIRQLSFISACAQHQAAFSRTGERSGPSRQGGPCHGIPVGIHQDGIACQGIRLELAGDVRRNARSVFEGAAVENNVPRAQRPGVLYFHQAAAQQDFSGKTGVVRGDCQCSVSGLLELGASRKGACSRPCVIGGFRIDQNQAGIYLPGDVDRLGRIAGNIPKGYSHAVFKSAPGAPWRIGPASPHRPGSVPSARPAYGGQFRHHEFQDIVRRIPIPHILGSEQDGVGQIPGNAFRGADQVVRSGAPGNAVCILQQKTAVHRQSAGQRQQGVPVLRHMAGINEQAGSQTQIAGHRVLAAQGQGTLV